MKAYSLSIKDNDDAGNEIVFAENAKAARNKIGDLADSLEEWIDLRVHRAKEYDGMEHLTDAQLANKQWRNGWRWFEMDYPDPDEATDDEFFKWYEANFSAPERKIT